MPNSFQRAWQVQSGLNRVPECQESKSRPRRDFCHSPKVPTVLFLDQEDFLTAHKEG